MLKTHALLRGMELMGYRVVNVGERDIREGYETFVERTAETSSLRFVSSNLVDKQTQQPIFAPHLVTEAVSPDGSKKLRIGVVGAMRFNPVFLKPGPEGREMVIVHPTERVRQEVAALRDEVDVIVLLAALHQNDARSIARDVEGIDFVVGSYGGLYTMREDRVGRTWMLYSGNQGKRLGSTRVYRNAEGEVTDEVTKIHFLTAAYPADTEMLAYVRSVPRRTPQVKAIAASDDPYLGAAACKTCHTSQYEQWDATGHARAMSTLESEGKQDDAACRTCHVTGSDREGGFRGLSETPHLAAVGCESCHGPGRLHVASTSRSYGKVSAATCAACHDFANSPDFDYYAYLPRVVHTPGAASASR
jgi:hypothetical protein